MGLAPVAPQSPGRGSSPQWRQVRAWGLVPPWAEAAQPHVAWSSTDGKAGSSAFVSSPPPPRGCGRGACEPASSDGTGLASELPPPVIGLRQTKRKWNWI